MVNWSETWATSFWSGRMGYTLFLFILICLSSSILSAQPGNDDCPASFPINTIGPTGTCASYAGTTVGASLDGTFPCTFPGDSPFVDVWYIFQISSGPQNVTFTSGSGNPYAVFYNGNSCASSTPFADGCLRGSGTVTNLPAGVHLLQILTPAGGTAFDFCLEFSGTAPSNNTCATAIPIQLGSPIAFDLSYATTDVVPPCVPAPNINLPDLWYTFTGPSNEEIAWSNNTGNVFLTIYEGSCGSLSIVSCGIPIGSPPNNLVPGQTYYAQISLAGTENSTQETVSAPGSFDFTAANSNNWSDGTNWQAGTPPSSTSQVTIPTGANCNLDVNFTSNSSITLEAGTTFSIDQSLTLNGTLTNNGNLGLNGTLKGNGTLVQSGTFSSGGTIAPGLSPGSLSVTGDYDMDGTTYDCEINGTTAGSQYDVINVSGTAYLNGGTLNVTWGFTPSDGQSFNILNAGTRNGLFTSTNIQPVAGRSFTINYLPTGVQIQAQATLPVELTDFEGKAIEDGKVLLTWTTATELENKGFEIQRMNKAGKWEILHFVDGLGTSFVAKDYRYVDENPRQGPNYYRLRQVDFDGSDWISPILSVEVKNGENSLSIYPNPNQGTFHLGLNEEVYEETTITITNLAQQKVFEKKWNPGNNPDKLDIDISTYPSGTYFLQWRQASTTFVERILVQKSNQ